MPLLTSRMSSLGVPPRTGTRQTSAGASTGCRTKSIDVALGVNVAPQSVTPGSEATTCALLVVAVSRTLKLALSPVRWTYATYRPSGEIAGRSALPLSVNWVTWIGERRRGWLFV